MSGLNTKQQTSGLNKKNQTGDRISNNPETRNIIEGG